MDESWKFELEQWLAPFLSVFGHKTRARICPIYVAGLIGAGAFPTGFERTRSTMGGGALATTERLPGRCCSGFSSRKSRKAPQIPYP